MWPRRTLKMVVKKIGYRKVVIKYVKSETNKLPFTVYLINHYLLFAEAIQGESKPDFLNKMLGFNDLRNEVVNDIIGTLQAEALPIISYGKIQAKFNYVVAKFERAKKWAKVCKSVNDTSFRGLVRQDL